MNSPNVTTVPLPPAKGEASAGFAPTRLSGHTPGGWASRQNWGKFKAHKWGGFIGRLECALANLVEPEMLADELFLLLEGARVTVQSMGPKGLGGRLVRMGEAMIKAHTIIEPEKSVN